jgi:uncharacterized protein YkwD
MNRRARWVLILTLASFGLAARGDDRAPPAQRDEALSPEEIAKLIAKVVALHNQERAKEKLNTLEISPKLTKAAQRHADDMARRKEMGHKGSDGSAPADRITDAGYRWRRVGENVAFGRWTPEQLLKGWMESPVHKKNILGSYSQIGVACATAEDGRIYWCVTFGLPIRP